MNEPIKSPYHDIIMTDITLHARTFRKPLTWYRTILKSFRSGKPGRAYFNNSIIRDKDGHVRISIPLPQAIQDQISAAKHAGKKVRIFVPKDGLPLLAGKDTIEFIKAHPELVKKVQKSNLPS